MNRSLIPVRCVGLILVVGGWLCPEVHSQINPAVATPPHAHQGAKVITQHGEQRVDPYFWLRDKTKPEVIAYLEAENKYTEAVTKPIEPLRDKLYNEMVARLKQTDLDVPVRDNGYYYYTKTEKGRQYPIFCRKAASLDAPEQVMLDANELASGKKFFSVGAREVSPNGHLLAYSSDITGYREYNLAVKDLRTGKLLADAIPKVTNVVWADDQTLFYGTEDAAKRAYRIYRHKIGSDAKTDALVYEEKDELFRVGVRDSRDKKYIYLVSGSSNTSEVRVIPTDKPESPPRVVLERETGHEYRVEHRDGQFYILSNKGKGNREFRLVSAPAADPKPENWKELIPARETTTLQSLALFKDHGVISGVDQGLPFLEILSFADGSKRRIAFPEPAYAAFPDANPEYDTNEFRYRYQSMVTPSSVYDYDVKTNQATLRKRTEVLGGYAPANYQAERLFATASDGTKIPVALVSKKGTPRDGSAPLLLYGYGSYGAPTAITFSSANLSLLDRGVVFAIAQIRGGGDLGKGWHDAGKMLQKRNSFTDFIACADYLVEQKYTSRDRLAIRGGSAGGLLVGAVCNFRPDLCKAAILEVPFVDVINTMSDASLPLTIQEYLEWGNPANPVEFAYMMSYSPYDNIKRVGYPAMLVRTSLNDSQVPYWEPAKYVAKMRTHRTDKNPVLFKINMDAGHGGASGRYDALKETAFAYAYLLDQFGIRN